MLVYEYKLDGTKTQCAAIDEAMRTVQFIRHICLCKRINEDGVSTNDLQAFCAVLAKQYPFSLASMRTIKSTNQARSAIPNFGMTTAVRHSIVSRKCNKSVP